LLCQGKRGLLAASAYAGEREKIADALARGVDDAEITTVP
jgi:hypothetical protein